MKKLGIETNEFLEYDVEAYYNGYHRGWSDTQVGYINTLKNDDGEFGNHKKDFGYTLSGAADALYSVLQNDLPIIASSASKKFTICIVPRSKRVVQYKPNQLLFSSIIKKFVLNNLAIFNDGTGYIERTTDTATTHLTRESIEKGVTNKTCYISDDIKGKDILLIDDIYTKSVNIDEDAIQALYDKGANSVTFYALGKTIH